MSCAGVFERSELESLLLDARVKGKARPEILEQFNEAKQCVCSCSCVRVCMCVYRVGLDEMWWGMVSWSKDKNESSLNHHALQDGSER